MKKELKKWVDLLKETVKIPEEHLEKVALYAHNKALMENEIIIHQPKQDYVNTLAISFKIFEKINLSKINIPEAPIFGWNNNVLRVQTQEFSVKINDELRPVLSQQQIIDHYEHVLIEMITEEMNKIIDEGKLLHLYDPIASLAIITEAVNPQMLVIRSRYTISDE